MKLRFSVASQCDISIIFSQAKMLVDAYEDLSAIDYHKVMEWIERKIIKNISQYQVVLKDEKPCAYYRLCEDGELDDLYVLPPFRNMGIGSEIMRKCITESEQPMYLYVFVRNTKAISFYERFGFIKRESIGLTRMIMVRKG